MWNDFESAATLNADALAHSGAREIIFGATNHLVVRLDSDDESIIRHSARQMHNRVANRHPDFQNAPRLHRTRSDFQKERDLTIRNRYMVLLCIGFHLRDDSDVGWQQAFEIIRLLTMNDGIRSCFHYGSLPMSLLIDEQVESLLARNGTMQSPLLNETRVNVGAEAHSLPVLHL